MKPLFTITAYDHVTNKRIELFRWCRSNAEQGIERAKDDAKHFGLAAHLSDYRAEPIEERKQS